MYYYAGNTDQEYGGKEGRAMTTEGKRDQTREKEEKKRSRERRRQGRQKGCGI